MNNLLAVTLGDSSGIGPELLLKAFREGQIRYPLIVYGDLEPLNYYNDRLRYEVPMRPVLRACDYEPGFLNVLDQRLLTRADITPGTLNAKSGSAAREYVIAASRAALAGDVAALVTLPMNKQATQMSDPTFVGRRKS